MERQERIALLVDQALELAPSEREAFVAARSDGDEVIRREVEELLAASDEMESGFLEQPATLGLRAHDLDIEEVDADAEEQAGPDPMVGRTIGAYRLETLLGRGGMGAVYLAHRADDEYEHQVAVKLLHPGFSSAGLVRRLRSERQILARLDHPNIAKLLDGGTTEDGQPYLVMERIAGMRIDDYCDEHGLGIRERLLLFRQVCAAVHFAHQNLVVHRDLKPSNILVTAQGTPKLLDFGIAKLVDASELPPSAEVTRSLLHAMTPSYASPEQLAGRNVTTVSDVYSLGVILYKLLTGRLPRRVDLRSPQALQAELAREPEKPSTAASREDDETTEPPSGSRGRLDTRHLRRQLSGDLDTIVLMALRPEPERRYGSVEQLTDDLRRHLEGLPVRARRGTFTYRAAKFLRRNRLAVAAAAVIFGLVLGLATTATLQARRIAREREAAEQQRGRAERERDKAQRVADFMAQLFDAARTQGITARELLDQGAAKLYGELAADDPEVRATLLVAVGKVYADMGLVIEGKRHLQEALRVREKLFGPNHLDVADVAQWLGWTAMADGELVEAEKQAQRALRIREEQLPANDLLIAESLLVLGQVNADMQRLEAAEELTRRALRIQVSQLGPAADPITKTYNYLGLIYRDQGKSVRAEATFRRALANEEHRLGPDHPALATPLNNVALVLHDRGFLAEAAPYYRRSIELKERSDGETPRLAASLYNLAYLERMLGKYSQAERRLVRAQKICEAQVGPENPPVGRILAARGLIHRDRGELELAAPPLQRAMRMVEASLGSEHKLFAQQLLYMASIDFRRGRLGAAAAAQERALRIFRTQPEPANAEVSAATRDLAQVVASQGDAERAASLLAEVVTATEERRRKDPENREDLALLASALVESGRLAAAAGDEEAASSRFRRAVELVEPFAVDSQVIEYGRVYAEALILLDRANEARPLVERLLSTGWRDPYFLSLLRDHGLR